MAEVSRELNNVMVIKELTLTSIVFRVLITALISGLIGIERRLKNQPAGSRTYMIVSLGACLVMMTNQYASEVFQTGDPVRLGAQVISGIGFLGAGTIMVTRSRQVRGLTTAAGLWSSACIGLAVGLGFYEGAIIVGVVILLIMTILRKVDDYVQSKTRYYNLYLNFSSSDAMNEFLDFCNSRSIKVIDIQISKGKGEQKGDVIAITTVKSPKKTQHSELVTEIGKLDGIKYIEEI